MQIKLEQAGLAGAGQSLPTEADSEQDVSEGHKRCHLSGDSLWEGGISRK